MNSHPNPHLDQVQALLLDLVAPTRPVQQARLDARSPEEWRSFLELARLHRLEPLLHWQLGRAHPGLRFPPGIKTGLGANFKAAALRGLRLQRELLLLHRLLAAAGIPHVALKGAFLAFHAYPNAAMRPMRDLDILVPGEWGARAFQLLLDNGFSRVEQAQGDVDVHLELHKHLPGLRSPGKVHVELHTRSLHAQDEQEVIDYSATQAFWDRCVVAPFANATILCESPADLLLDLIVHAVARHQFDNGPLLLSDIAYLVTGYLIDWPLFWALAQRSGQQRACFLALRLVERYWGPQPISWPSGEEPDAEAMAPALDIAESLLLRDYRRKLDLKLGMAMAEEANFGGRLRLLLGKLFPSRTKVAALHPVAADSWQVYLWYPVVWWDKAWRRLPAFLRSRGDNQLRGEAERLAAIERWLAEPEDVVQPSQRDGG